jgi:hypothetical protein
MAARALPAFFFFLPLLFGEFGSLALSLRARKPQHATARVRPAVRLPGASLRAGFLSIDQHRRIGRFSLQQITVPGISHDRIRLDVAGERLARHRSDIGKGHPQYYQDRAARLAAETPGALYINQFENPANPRAAILPTTRMIWIETPSNPLLQLGDLAAVAEISRKNGLISVTDNTFASPIIQRPLEYGFDIVVHSATKYLNGHSDMIGGVAVVAGNQDLRDGLALLQEGVGGILGPFESFLALRGLKTFPLRMARHCDDAMTIAIWLETHPAVARVIYPGLPSHPQYQLAC